MFVCAWVGVLPPIFSQHIKNKVLIDRDKRTSILDRYTIGILSSNIIKQTNIQFIYMVGLSLTKPDRKGIHRYLPASKYTQRETGQ